MKPERVYASVLWLYPTGFRQEYGDTMMETFRELHRHTDLTPLRFWLLVLAGECRTACRERLNDWRSGTRILALQWVLACTLGAVVTGILGSALTASFKYLYHPYLEGLRFPLWSYGSILGIGMGGAQCLVLRPRWRLGSVWMLISALSAAIGLEAAIMVANAAGPLGYGIVLGGIVGSGQWMVLRKEVRRDNWWGAASAVALCAGVISVGLAVSRTVHEMNALPSNVLEARGGPGLDVLLRGLYAPTSWAELAVAFAVMATSGLVVGAVTAKPLSSILARAH